jgi:hypothetical protein
MRTVISWVSLLPGQVSVGCDSLGPVPFVGPPLSKRNFSPAMTLIYIYIIYTIIYSDMDERVYNERRVNETRADEWRPPSAGMVWYGKVR